MLPLLSKWSKLSVADLLHEYSRVEQSLLSMKAHTSSHALWIFSPAISRLLDFTVEHKPKLYHLPYYPVKPVPANTDPLHWNQSPSGRRHHVAGGGRSVAPRWPRVVARLHRSAGGESHCPFGPGRSIALGVDPGGVSTGRWVVGQETGQRGSGGPCVPGQ